MPKIYTKLENSIKKSSLPISTYSSDDFILDKDDTFVNANYQEVTDLRELINLQFLFNDYFEYHMFLKLKYLEKKSAVGGVFGNLTSSERSVVINYSLETDKDTIYNYLIGSGETATNALNNIFFNYKDVKIQKRECYINRYNNCSKIIYKFLDNASAGTYLNNIEPHFQNYILFGQVYSKLEMYNKSDVFLVDFINNLSNTTGLTFKNSQTSTQFRTSLRNEIIDTYIYTLINPLL